MTLLLMLISSLKFELCSGKKKNTCSKDLSYVNFMFK